MSRVKTIIALVAIVLVVIFALQNSADTALKFMLWQLKISQALLIVCIAAIGVIIGLVVGLNSSLKASKNAKELNKSQAELQRMIEAKDLENKKLMGQADNLNAQIENLNNQVQQLQSQLQNPGVTPQDFNDSVDALEI